MTNPIKKTVKKIVKPVVMHIPVLRKTYRTISWNKKRKQYLDLSSSIPTNDKMIVFESFMGRSYSCSPKAIYEAMKADPRFKDFKYVWIFRGSALESHENMPELSDARIVQRGSIECKQALAEAKYWVFNSRSPEYLVPKADQVYIQCWHGTPLKRLGCDIEIETSNALNTSSELAERYKIESSKWSFLVSPSAYATEHLGDAFGIPEEKRQRIIVEQGYPRNDWLARICASEELLLKEQSRIKNKYGIPQNKKVLLYAPTWRDDDYKDGVGYIQNPYIDFSALQDNLGTDWVVLFRAHYFIANQIDLDAYQGFAFNVSDADDINELYAVSDALTTDYSSVFFDYAVTRRPMVFYMPDLDHYADSIRGFYFDLNELPGPICKTQDELTESLLNIEGVARSYEKSYQAFHDKFCPYEDGHASYRVISRCIMQ